MTDPSLTEARSNQANQMSQHAAKHGRMSVDTITPNQLTHIFDHNWR